MDKRGSSGSCDSCHTYIWLFPVRLMFLQMVSALLIHSAKTSGQQLFPLHRQATQDSHHGCSGDFDSFWFREITRQSGESSWSPNVMGLLWHGTSVWYWVRLRGEEKQNRISSVFPAHFPSSTGRKLLSLKVQSAVEMDMAKHYLPYLVSLDHGKHRHWVIYQLLWLTLVCTGVLLIEGQPSYVRNLSSTFDPQLCIFTVNCSQKAGLW